MFSCPLNISIQEGSPNWAIKVASLCKIRAINSELVDLGSPDIDFFMLILFSSALATLGLIDNRPAVIIGAQLIGPLISPI